VGQKATGSLRVNGWSYFSFNANSSSIYVHMRELAADGSGGYLWLFASDDTIPTLKYVAFEDSNFFHFFIFFSFFFVLVLKRAIVLL
jgi:hypothetical protein